MLGSVFPCLKGLGFTEFTVFTTSITGVGAFLPSKTTFFVSWHQTNAQLFEVKIVL
jgi:hypothetical protein